MTDCYRGGWKYDDFEKTFLTFIREIDLANVIGQLQPDNEQARLKDQIRETEGRLLEARTQRDRAFSLVLGQAPSEFLNQKVREYDLLVTNLETNLEDLKKLQQAIMQQSVSFEDGKEGLGGLVGKLQSTNDEEVFSLRSAVAFHLRGLIEEIHIWPAGSSFYEMTPSIEANLRDMFGDERWEAYKSTHPTKSSDQRCFSVTFKDKTFRFVRPGVGGKFFMMAATKEPIQTKPPFQSPQ
jgi:hypothetical protein